MCAVVFAIVCAWLVSVLPVCGVVYVDPWVFLTRSLAFPPCVSGLTTPSHAGPSGRETALAALPSSQPATDAIPLFFDFVLPFHCRFFPCFSQARLSNRMNRSTLEKSLENTQGLAKVTRLVRRLGLGSDEP